MADRQVKPPNVALVVAILALAGGAVAVIAVRSAVPRKARPVLSSRFQPDWQGLGEVDPALIGFEEEASFAVGIDGAACMAVGPQDKIRVGGNSRIAIFAADGRRLGSIDVASPVTAMDVTADGKILAAMGDHMEVVDPAGGAAVRWAIPYDGAVLTGVAVRGDDVFASDYGKSVVLRYDLAGNLLGRLGGPDYKGFQVPSPTFDLAFAPDGMLRVVNPGALQIEAWTTDGFREFAWGSASPDLDGFVGCCNPAHIAVMPDGRMVTSEKGIARIKVFKADRGFGQNGQLDCLVAGPDSFADQTAAPDIATDSRGRVMALDIAAGMVKVFRAVDRDSAE
jgi:hypothetical protein